MNCELISVGTEILLGDILNSNAQYLSKELASLGIGVTHQCTVGDNRERLLSALERANLIAEEKGQTSRRSYVKLKVDYNSLIITSSSQNGKVIDEMDAIHEGNDIEIAFNGRYLLNSIRVAEGENVKITLVSPTKAITIVPTEKSEEFDYLYMILPMRMNEEK